MARTVLDVSDLEQGAPPAIAWSERRSGRTVIHGTGGTTTPAANRLDRFAPMGSGYVVQTIGGRVTTRWIGADGTPGRREWRTGYGLAVSPLGNVVAFAGRAGKVWTIDQEGDRVFRFNPAPVTGTAHAVAVTGENCKEGEGDPGFGCSIAVNGPHRAFYTSSHGIVDTRPPPAPDLDGPRPVARRHHLGHRLRLVQRDAAQLAGPVGDLRQPALRHLPGQPPRPRHPGVRRRLRPQRPRRPRHRPTARWCARFTAARDGSSATYFDEVWEDAEHVLVVTYQDGEWAVVRLGVDGSMEYAVAPRRGSVDTWSPFRLQTR